MCDGGPAAFAFDEELKATGHEQLLSVAEGEVGDEVHIRKPLTFNLIYEQWWDGAYTIIPDRNPILDVWDVFVILALLATALVMPFEVALVTTTPPVLKRLDSSINAVFIIDIFVTFNVAYSGDAYTNQGVWERCPRKIAKHYMAVPFSDNMSAGWFWPDLVTVIPWEAFLSTRSAASVRMVRVLRLLRMLRLVRVVKLFTRSQTKFGFSYAIVRIARCIGVTTLALHWLACVWAHLGLYGKEYGDEGVEETWLHHTQLSETKDIVDFTWMETYTLALYLCTVVLTTVGFGDITPVSSTEVSMMTISVFLTGLTWAWVVANVVGVIGSLDLFQVNFNQTMDDLNDLMSYRRVDSRLQARARSYMHEAYYVHQSRHHWKTVSALSEGLQGELAVQSGVDKVCRSIWFLKNARFQEWVVEISREFVQDLYSPGELIVDRSSLSVIRKGSCIKKHRVLTQGAVFGEDMILVTEVLRDSACPRSLTICEVMKLSRESLRMVCEKHHSLNLQVRRAQIYLALGRAVVFLANKLRYMRAKGTYRDVDIRDLDLDVTDPLKSKKSGWVQNCKQHDGGLLGLGPQLPPSTTTELDVVGTGAEVQEIMEMINTQHQQTMQVIEELETRVGNIEQRTSAIERQLDGQRPSR